MADIRVHTMRMSHDQYVALKERAFQAKQSLNLYTLDILFPPDDIELCCRGTITKEELISRLGVGLPVTEFLNGHLTYEGLRVAYQEKGVVHEAVHNNNN